ncbi:cellulase family glycosylhydrolase [Herpetosiphon geysericola]|uniref:Endoglucanase n=1 Tax=Herpetosiphon geysericola TaxID=70996 RepID=A0A0P6YKI0_9CHLR|nr:cellulase family glycosylhydrolase [Herpetosiphon geysericola]KPL90283.1 glycoside hydrolase [Herpetosiphon geysericola]
MSQKHRSFRTRLAMLSGLVALVLASQPASTKPTAAAAACEVTYTISNQWETGFTANVSVKNIGIGLNSWQLSWGFAGNQTITNLWNGTLSQTGPNVSVANSAWAASLPSNGTASFGFQASYSGTNAVPTAFKLNGVNCGDDQPNPTVTNTLVPTTRPATSTPTTPPNTTIPTLTSTPRPTNIATATSTPRPINTAIPTNIATATSTPIGNNNTDDWLHTNGNQIVDSAGRPVWLTGVNWFGFNATERVFHGLWSANLTTMLQSIAQRGLNIIRVPISTELILEWKAGVFKAPNVNTYANPELEGLNSLQIFDRFVLLSKQFGIKVMIDVHSAEADNAGHYAPLWYKGSITSEQFYQAWEWITDRYKNDDTVIAMDIKNEPHGTAHDNQISGQFAKWDNSTDLNNWKYVCETASKRILAINPNVLVLCEGNEVYPKAGANYSSNNKNDYYFTWWGGNLRGVRDYPVNLGANQDQLVYSPHDYGPLVFNQSWFYPGFTKETLYNDVWQPNWFFIHEENIAPLFIGEWGGFLDGGANEQWMKALRDLIKEHYLHHTFWVLNPNSGDTGGLLGYDWATWDEAKYALLKPALWADRNGKFVSLDHQIPLGGAATGTTITTYYQQANPAPTNP